MRNLILVVSLCLLIVLNIQAQIISEPQDNGWHGLIINVSSVDDAVKSLGKPVKDETNQKVEVVSVRGEDWLNGTQKQKIFRKLTFEKPERFAKARLYFKDNLLVVIELQPKSATEADFKPHNTVFGGKPLGKPEEFAIKGDPTTDKEIRAYYEMIGITEKCFVFARIDNTEPEAVGLFGANPTYNRKRKEKKKRDSNGNFPGNVNLLQIISRSLYEENKNLGNLK